MEFFEQFSTFSLILMAAILLLTLYFHGPVFSIHTAHNAPSILTSLGIFGTFLGVAVGLMHFDTADIQSSVPGLIEGLKTAFWTSITGLAGALTVKFRWAIVAIQKGNQVRKQGATFDDVVAAMDRVTEQMILPGDGHFATDLIALTKENTDAIKSMENSLKTYQEDITEANTKALMAALDKVMRDFNTEIDQQYGQNFRLLNESVGTMRQWQEENADLVRDLIERHKVGANAMDEATRAFTTLVGQSHAFSEVASDMETMLSGLHNQSSNIAEFLGKLSQLVVDAQQGLPDLEKRISQLTHVLKDSVEQSQSELTNTLTTLSSEIYTSVSEINNNLAKSVEESQHLMNSQLTEMLSQNNRAIHDLDKALESEMAKALKTFGYQLTALSEKFVNDYTPLTDKLQDLIRVAEDS